MNDSSEEENFQFGPNSRNNAKYSAEWTSDGVTVEVATEDFTIRYENTGDRTLRRDEFNAQDREEEAKLVDQALRHKLEEQGWDIRRS